MIRRSAFALLLFVAAMPTARAQVHASSAQEVGWNQQLHAFGLLGRLSFFQQETSDPRTVLDRPVAVAPLRPTPPFLSTERSPLLRINGLRAEIAGWLLGLDARASFILRGVDDRWPVEWAMLGASAVARAVPKEQATFQLGGFFQAARIDLVARFDSATGGASAGPPSRFSLTDQPARAGLDARIAWPLDAKRTLVFDATNLVSHPLGPGPEGLVEQRFRMSVGWRF
ncbi:hypothetical protein [Roseiterribacter gracilis]|uniref:TonB-dependent receptor-like beta-barrel domain-containing protein n=1 Tax=Roseiterribacter gracilis TaxID=2812848 RepID=A0A8S8XB20_9PROT|nr:hypothetical protein TMPK1_12880 [Rhodospirillales bacterium TMPK1]